MNRLFYPFIVALHRLCIVTFVLCCGRRKRYRDDNSLSPLCKRGGYADDSFSSVRPNGVVIPLLLSMYGRDESGMICVKFYEDM